MNETIVEYKGLKFPVSALHVLLAQSAAAEVRRQYEGNDTNVFEMIETNQKFQEEFLDSFVSACMLYFDNIKHHVPTSCHRLLDIGCGLGLISLLIYKNCPDNKPTLYMYDQSAGLDTSAQADIAPGGYHESYKFTASLEITKDFLLLNGVAPDHIVLCEVGQWEINQAAPLDLVVSRKSWGFHYPLDEYLEQVAASVRPGGAVITDVRRAKESLEKLESTFSKLEILSKEKKCDLVLATR